MTSNRFYGKAVTLSSDQFDTGATNTPAINSIYRTQARFAPNDFASTANGGTVATDTAGTLKENLNYIRIGSSIGGGSPYIGIIRKIKVHSRANISNAVLVENTL